MMVYAYRCQIKSIMGGFMSTISLRTNQTNDVTVISNIFIDSYMPTANGAYVKVYLYLLRCLTNQNFELSISTIADRLEDTEKDIMRAISYWEKVNLISITRDNNNQITNITLNNPAMETQESVDQIASTATDTPEETQAIPASVSEKTVHQFDKPTYSKVQIEELSKDNNVKLIMAVVESYMQRPLKPMDQQLILYLYESVGFSADLIMYLYEYCISNNKKNSSYIEAVALAWANEGIDTEEKAKLYTNKYNKSYQAINKAFGLNRTPGEIEIQFIKKWINKLNFSMDIIVEACNRTLLRVGKPDFNYADRILEKWASSKVKTLADITKLDDAHAAKQTNKPVPAKAGQVPQNTTNKFNNFTQRNYSKEDFRKMEQLLLNKQ